MMLSERETTSSFVNDLMRMLASRGRALLRPSRGAAAGETVDLEAVGHLLLSRRGEASSAALARRLLEGYERAPPGTRVNFLIALAERFGVDQDALRKAIAA